MCIQRLNSNLPSSLLANIFEKKKVILNYFQMTRIESWSRFKVFKRVLSLAEKKFLLI